MDESVSQIPTSFISVAAVRFGIGDNNRSGVRFVMNTEDADEELIIQFDNRVCLPEPVVQKILQLIQQDDVRLSCVIKLRMRKP